MQLDIKQLTKDLLADIDRQYAEAEERLLALMGQRRGIQLMYERLLEEAHKQAKDSSQPTSKT